MVLRMRRLRSSRKIETDVGLNRVFRDRFVDPLQCDWKVVGNAYRIHDTLHELRSVTLGRASKSLR
jgi:hypothetical protein